MRLFVSLIRTLVIVLVTVRVVAAPLAMRPESPRYASKYRLVARVCAWPAQRLERPISAASLVPRFKGKGPHHSADHGHNFGPVTIVWLSPVALSTFLGRNPHGSSLAQLSIHLRC
jgi:hypothetical protein